MTERFTAMVRFDVGPRVVRICVGGHVAPQGLGELCDVIGRSVEIAGGPAEVDLQGARIDDETLVHLREWCEGLATVSSPRA